MATQTSFQLDDEVLCVRCHYKASLDPLEPSKSRTRGIAKCVDCRWPVSCDVRFECDRFFGKRPHWALVAPSESFDQ